MNVSVIKSLIKAFQEETKNENVQEYLVDCHQSIFGQLLPTEPQILLNVYMRVKIVFGHKTRCEYSEQ